MIGGFSILVYPVGGFGGLRAGEAAFFPAVLGRLFFKLFFPRIEPMKKRRLSIIFILHGGP